MCENGVSHEDLLPAFAGNNFFVAFLKDEAQANRWVQLCSRLCLLIFLDLCYTPGMTKHGRLISHDLRLELHEKKTIDFFLCRGKDIELNLPSLTPGTSNPDFWMDGLVWEMKCPVVVKDARLAILFRKASHQSKNVIFDLRRLPQKSRSKVRDFLIKLFRTSRTVRRLIIIMDDGKMEELKK